MILPLLLGCASLIEGQAGMGREICFTSNPSGALIAVNGVPRGETPCNLAFNAYEIRNASLTASKDGFETLTLNLKNGVNRAIVGNIIFGGVGGLLVDGLSGSSIKNLRIVRVTLEPKFTK